MVTTVNNTVLCMWTLRIDFKVTHYKKKLCVRWQILTRPTADHFAMCTTIKSLFCTLKTNFTHQLLLKKKKKRVCDSKSSTTTKLKAECSQRLRARSKVQDLPAYMAPDRPCSLEPFSPFQSLPVPHPAFPRLPHLRLPAVNTSGQWDTTLPHTSYVDSLSL